MYDPRSQHMSALERIIWYVKSTLEFRLHLSPSSIHTLLSYTNINWGGYPHTRRSILGYCVYLDDNLIFWSTKRQSILSWSSAEVEYQGVANVVSNSCWLPNLLLELHCPISKTTLVYCDNIRTIYLSDNLVQHYRTKHVEIDIHFVCEKVAKGLIRVLHIPSCYQIPDNFS